jgi:hypothetical protein
MMEAVLSVDKVKCLVTEKRDEGFFSQFFINRMCTTDETRQQRQIDTPQHIWHMDGCGETPAVLTIYDSEQQRTFRQEMLGICKSFELR